MAQLHASYMVVICFMPHYKGVGAYFDAFLNLSVTCQLHASYMPVTWLYSSTNLVNKIFHKLWQISNYITILPWRLLA